MESTNSINPQNTIQNNQNNLGIKTSFWRVFGFAFPSICMMIFTAFYTMVDGIFVANFVGDNALAAINITLPGVSILFSFGIMFASGGSAIIAKKLGEGKIQEARKDFTVITSAAFFIALVLMSLGFLFLEDIIWFLGASVNTFNYCYDYALTLLLFTVCALLQVMLQNFLITAGRPVFAFVLSLSGGITNIVLDYLFIAVFEMGIVGAALATGIGYSVPTIIGLLYFFFNKKGTLRFTKTTFCPKTVLRASANGSSEMVSNLAMALTTFLFNLQLGKLLGDPGIAAITIILYAQFLLHSILIGYAMGVSPLISFNYGEGNTKKLKQLFKNNLAFMSIVSVATFFAGFFFSDTLVSVFSDSGSAVFDIASEGMKIFSFGFIIVGINIFASAQFTALGNGLISAIISAVRTLIFLVACIMVLPLFLGVTGIWLAVPVSEVLSLVFSLLFLVMYRKKYQYA